MLKNRSLIIVLFVMLVLVGGLGIFLYTRSGGKLPGLPADTDQDDSSSLAQPPVTHEGWTAFVNSTNRIEDMIFDQEGYLWTVNSGGLVKWDVNTGSFARYTTVHGLPSNSLYAVAVDQEGHVWVSFGLNGIARYDGSDWKTFDTSDGLASDAVNTFAVFGDDFWVGTGSGLSKYEGGKFRKHNRDGTWQDYITGIARAEDGSLWCSTWAGVARYDGSDWRQWGKESGLPDQLFDIAVAPDGTVWTISSNGAYQYKDDSWTAYSYDEGVRIQPRSLVIDPAGNVWIGGMSEVVRYDGSEWKSFTDPDSPANSFAFGGQIDLGQPVFGAAVSPEGTVWFGSYRGGVSGYMDGEWKTHTIADGLPANPVQALALDDEGRLWVGTGGAGVARYAEGDWEQYGSAQGLKQFDVWDLLVTGSGDVWAGFRTGGAARYAEPKWDVHDLPVGSYGMSAWIASSCERADGSLWFGTEGDGIFVFENGKWSQIKSSAGGLGSDDVYAITEALDGSLWVGTFDGAYRYEGGKWSHERGTETIYDIVVDQEGALWFSSYGKGVFRYQDGIWNQYGTREGLCSAYIRDIELTPDGTLWFGSQDVAGGEGACSYDSDNWTAYTAEDGLASDNVWAIEATEAGVWFGTEGGLSYLEL